MRMLAVAKCYLMAILRSEFQCDCLPSVGLFMPISGNALCLIVATACARLSGIEPAGPDALGVDP
jgi:hypothetical protein